MTQTLVRQLLKKGYISIAKINATELAAAKVKVNKIVDDTDIDILTINKNEDITDLPCNLDDDNKLIFYNLKTFLIKNK